jgi:hypothetical protein
MRDFHAECVKFIASRESKLEFQRDYVENSVGTRYAREYSNPVGSGLWSRGVHMSSAALSLEPLLASMDLVHESTTPEAALRPCSVGFVLRFIGMVRPIQIGLRTSCWPGARRRFRRLMGRDHQS